MSENNVVVMTGAAGGLGRVMTAGLLAAGRSVVAVDVEQARAGLDEVVAAARAAGAGDRILPLIASIRSEADCAGIVKKAIAHFGTIHALVNNAGMGMNSISHETMTKGISFYNIPADAWRDVIDTNVNGSFLMASAVAPQLVKAGWGRIINVTTSYFTMIKKQWSPYGPSKAALEAASAIWAIDLADTGVSVNVLVPGGAADTPLVPIEVMTDRSGLVAPIVMVAPVVWLTSKASDGVNGQRFIGKDWDPAAPLDQNIKSAGALSGWRS